MILKIIALSLTLLVLLATGEESPYSKYGAEQYSVGSTAKVVDDFGILGILSQKQQGCLRFNATCSPKIPCCKVCHRYKNACGEYVTRVN